MKIFRSGMHLGYSPLIIGRTGEGKTFLVNFICSCLFGDQVVCNTIDAGTKVSVLLDTLANHVKLAESITPETENNFGMQ